ncbi:unnamed protein product [Rotaria sp. Silwood1]|nr:unnamed protein product [Rotaria sp. Silwood1]
MQKIFNIDFNFDELNDDKGDIYLSQQTYHDSSSQQQIKIYYAKCLLCRENNRYHMNLAYCEYISTASIMALFFQNRKAIDKDLRAARAFSYNAIHQRLKDSWPERVILQWKKDLPD